jgi:uncharacterized cofD-like protein
MGMKFLPKNISGWKWLYPGMGVKRWLLLLMLGITCISLGFAYFLVNIYRQQSTSAVFYYLTLQFVPRLARAILVGGLGLVAVMIAVVQLSRSLLAPFLRPGQQVAKVVYEHRQRGRGPRVVVIGGGTGLSILLRGLKEYTSNITAIVTVADDGGSSGRLRRELGVLPPGDFRNCIAALADAESLTTQLFQYRFNEVDSLDGHNFGNLFIAAMADVTGSFERAILESGRVLAVQGRILPSTLNDVTLCADLRGEDEAASALSRVEGESSITAAELPIERVFLLPDKVRAYPETIRAILEADLIVVGPGSLFTSVLPNLLVEDITKAVRASRALKIHVCNVATQRGETDGFSVGDHVEAIERHVGRNVFHHVLVNDNFDVKLDPHSDTELVSLDCETDGGYQVVSADVIDPQKPWRHDPQKLASTLMNFYSSQL